MHLEIQPIQRSIVSKQTKHVTFTLRNWQQYPKQWLRGIGNYFISFFEQSCIHGLLYLVKSGLTLFEKFFWLVLLIVSFVFCVFIGLESVDRYKTKSTVVSLERNYYYWRTKTAGITICPMVRLNVEYFDEFCRTHHIDGQRKEEFFDFLENLANSTYTNFDQIPEYNSIDNILDELQIQPKDYMRLIYNLTGDLTQADEEIRVSTQTDSTFIHTRQVLTEWGLCYMVNTVLGLEFTAKYMIFGKIPEEYTNLAINYTAKDGTYFDNDITFNFFGFTSPMDMFVHSAYEIMHIDRNFGYFAVPQDVNVESSPIVTEDNFEERTTVSQRKCRFSRESNLEHYPIYTKNMCLQECRLNLAYKLCKCIPHFYPNLIKNPKPVCSYKQLKECFPDKKSYFLEIFRFQSKHAGFKCECLQNCYDANIFISHSFTMYTSEELFGSLGVIVRMKIFPTYRLKRQIMFTFTDLLVSIGGTAGLFLGFSVLGAVEILYYFSLRLFWYLRGYKI